MTNDVFFTTKDGWDARITGDQRAVEALVCLIQRAGIRYNENVGTWDEGYYNDTPKPRQIHRDSGGYV